MKYRSDMSSLNLQKLKDFLAAQAPIRFAYLFGSYAMGRANAMSDVDVAVYLDDSQDFFTMRLKLMEQIHRHVGDHIDLVVLNDSSVVLQYEVIRHDKVLKDNKQLRVEFETTVLREYLDSEPLREVHREELKKSFDKYLHKALGG